MNSLRNLIVICLLFSFNAWAVEDVVHRSGAKNLQSNGWHLAKSTEGGFSVQVPWPFVDTTVNGTSPMYTIISASKNATTYTAFLVPIGTQPGMYKVFSKDLNNPNMEVGKYKENTSIYEVETIEEQGFKFVMHTKRIKTDFGIYVLMVMAQTQNERPSDIETFFKSLIIAAS